MYYQEMDEEIKNNKKQFKEKQKQELVYEFSQVDEDITKIPKAQPLQIGFRHISTIVQIKDLDEEATYQFFESQVKNKIDENKLRARITCVKNWVEKYAEEQFTFRVRKSRSEEYFNSLSDVDKKALNMLKEALGKNLKEKELEEAIFEIPKTCEMQMSDFFKLCYQTIVEKDKGPKLAAFIKEIGEERIISIL